MSSIKRQVLFAGTVVLKVRRQVFISFKAVQLQPQR